MVFVVVYIEYLLIDNIVINYCLLSLTCKVLKKDTNKKKLLIASIIGALSCFVYPLLANNFIIANLFKIALAAAMLFVGIKKLRPKQFIFSFMILLGLTYLLGAILTKIYAVTNVQYGLAYQPALPVGISIMACIAYSKLLKAIINKLTKNNKMNTYIYKTTFTYNDKKITEQCYLDSGNNLFDNQNNQPITIINYDLLFQLTDISPIDIVKKQTSLKNAHYQKVATLTGESEMLIFQIDRMEIICENKKHLIENASIGLTNKKIFKSFNCCGLLNAQLMEE